MIGKKEMQKIRLELQKWRNEYPFLTLPKDTKKIKEEYLKNVYLAKDEKKIMISGGGRILLWFAIVQGNRSWRKHLNKLKKSNNVANYLEVLKFRYRERLLYQRGLIKESLIKNVDENKLIDESELA